jgi:uncharacterized protein YbjQ (UPF0145 family)
MADILLQHLNLLVFMTLFVVGYTSGSIAEKRHYRLIEVRERASIRMPVVTAEARFPEGKVARAFLVQGNVVISIDYFKRVMGILRNIFGGRIRAYESLVDRARREAILRMKEQALAGGGQMVTNLRLETSTIGKSANRKGRIGSVEVIAYGTAVRFNSK